jgi:hypothetical protein
MGQMTHIRQIVGHEDEGRGVPGLEGKDGFAHFPAKLRIQRSQRLVQQEHRRACHHGPGQRDPMALAPRECCSAASCEPLQAYGIKGLPDTRPDLRVGDPSNLKGEGHIAFHAQVRKEHGRLMQIDGTPGLRRERGDIAPTNLNGATQGGCEPSHAPEERGLADARRTQNNEAFSAGDHEIHAREAREAREA